MNTTTASYYHHTDNVFRRLIGFLAVEIRRSLELTGSAYMHGVPPL
jgi:hypothetical protein